ncbi:MAG: Peptidase S11 D-alanyl-D-alanine carboxypeptidase 1 [Candidatus Gottesmanbacteria bacterium GW2011_GWC1_43_10]|nr:MAG: Peptidase S11 D-alanyl-D-alanine carboxypeptidase 1 [Candidatus Gottesmanbacteria bacterium GW2011_GWC1_43_10]HCM38112.1 D-alanyl-D-alanine carboxypeptidase [Patescibacteria group bacterium]
MNWMKTGAIFLGLGLIGVGGILFSKFYQPNVLGVVSPLVDDTETVTAKRIIFDRKTIDNFPPNTFFPKTLTPKFSESLDVSAQAYAVMERHGRELLFSKNLTQELPIASVAKIMTTLVALEKSRLDQELKVSSAAVSIGEAQMGLTSGESVAVEDLLYGLMLPSGNDAAETLAEGLGPGRSAFIQSMNETARCLGMLDTFFYNPTGLDGETRDKTTFSTPLDLLSLTNYALTNPTFAQVVATYYKEIPYLEDKHKAFYLYNILQLERSYPGIKGVKPGVTDFAGETLVSYAENGGKQIIIILLNTQHSLDDAVKIYDVIFNKLGVKVSGRS